MNDINYGMDTGMDMGYPDTGMDMGMDMGYPVMPSFFPRRRKKSCIQSTIYLVAAGILACCFCIIFVKNLIKNPLNAGISGLCSQLCCLAISTFIVTFIIKYACKENQTIAWGIVIMCVCIQCVCIMSLGFGMF